MNQSTAYELLATMTSNRLSDLLKNLSLRQENLFVYFRQLDFILIKLIFEF